ncbi:MAG: GGDEF domain-containing protein [Oscillospiraceae bacterium]|nr:GGDEF domain-containing protein [Oscillospiraceae bacterium]
MKSAIETGKIKYAVLMLIITAVFVTACVFYLLGFRFVLEKDNLFYFNEIATESANTVEIKLDTLITSMNNYAPMFSGFNSVPVEERAERIAAISDVSQFYDIAYIEIDGTATSSYLGNAILIRRAYFRNALAGVSNISEIVVSEFNGMRVNVFAVPVYTGDEITGVLAGAVESGYLNELMNSQTFNGMASSYIMNTEGIIILTPQKDPLGVDTGISFFDVISDISDKDIAANISAVDASGSFTFRFEDQDYFAAYNSIDISEWVVLTLARCSDVHAVTYNVFGLALAFTIAIVIIAIACIIILSIKHWLSKKRYAETVNERDFLKYTDPLTGGPSYEKFLDEVTAIFASKNEKENYAVISMDINKFRTINDRDGYDVGNRILVDLAQVVQDNLNTGEAYTRKNADLFYILLKYNYEADIFARVDDIISESNYNLNDLKITLLFGVYMVDDSNIDFRSILDHADLARRTIKNSSESRCAFFDNNLLTKIREEKKIESVMEYALERNEFRVYLQPKYDLRDRSSIIGAEALVRWFRDGKMIPPGGFIPLFEKNGFILKIDRFVFEEVCKQQRIWLSRGYDVRVISVNMSRVNLQQPNFVRDLYRICNKYNVPTKYFEIEITESVAFENLEILTRVFNELKNYGFYISIDDFGTGYSSLNMLKDLPVDVLKIDRSFLTDSGKNERANSIISHVIKLALSLHMKTICEGIETSDQVSLLSGLGCDMAQGFYFDRPMSIEEYEKKLYSHYPNTNLR